MLLAIETATNICSVVFQNNRREIFEKRSETHGSHSENLFLFIDELMKKHSFSVNELDAILVSEGPGSYTGLRIAASGVKGLLFGSDVPLYGVNTLASFAIAAAKEHPRISNIHSIIDARRKHLYHQSFLCQCGELAAESSLEVRTIEKVEQIIQAGAAVIGTGLNRLNTTTSEKVVLIDEKFISARSLIQLYEAEDNTSFYRKVDAAKFSPQYYNQKKKPQINTD